MALPNPGITRTRSRRLDHRADRAAADRQLVPSELMRGINQILRVVITVITASVFRLPAAR